MPYIIDGHNLIPKVRGLSLQRLDDELELIKKLQTFSRVRRQKVEVYFDKAAPGRQGSRNFGVVKAHFVPAASNADTAIRIALRQLGNKAKNWRVVSSDRQVQAEARGVHAGVVSSEEFAAQLDEVLLQSVKSEADGQTLSQDEIEEWLKLFSKGGGEGK